MFTHTDDPLENRWFRSVAEVAASHKLPTFAPEDVNHELWVEKIKEYNPDVIFSFYYKKLLKPDLLAIPKSGCLNLHGSLLPKYRGRVPLNWALINGEKETGVTLHFMTPKPDEGDIVGQLAFEICDSDTAKNLHEKACEASQSLLDQLLPKIKSNNAPRTKQDNSLATYFGGRSAKDGEIHWKSDATSIRNLVRAVTLPFPGAFSYLSDKKCLFWNVSETPNPNLNAEPGTVVATKPLTIACGSGALKIESGQVEGGLFLDGEQLATQLQLVPGMRFGAHPAKIRERSQKKNVLILGVNGFIGNALSRRLLDSGRFEVFGMDLNSNHIKALKNEKHFHFHEGDIAVHREWIEYHIKKCDIVVPLVAIATPKEYVRNPIGVFELDFEENLRIVRYCVKYGKRLIFPSTSEVYGMCEDKDFDEENSNLTLGPIRMQRWIYSCSKQLLDRVIYAYGQKEGLKFTLFRPFNWIGPRLDSLDSARIGSSRAITQLILNLVQGTPIQLVDGGHQKRCFTDISDGVECLFRIIEDANNTCDQRIINIGNPDNEASIKEQAEALVEMFESHPLRKHFPPLAGYQNIESKSFYGEGYQDVQHRKPSIRNAKRLLNWEPKVELTTSIQNTLDFFLKEEVSARDNLKLEERKKAFHAVAANENNGDEHRSQLSH